MNTSSNESSSSDDSPPQPRKRRKLSYLPSQKETKSISHTSSYVNKKRKRRFRSNSTDEDTRNSKEDVEPWWIGQRLIFEVNGEANGREATIRDYDINKKLSHIWYETLSHNYENVNLFDMTDWDIPSDRPLHEQIEFVPDNEWIPIYYKMKERVLVRFDGKFGGGSQFAAFVDGYDPISRRHHVNYGDTTEWIWATKERVSKFKNKCDEYIELKRKQFVRNRDEVVAPPWNPFPYGLDKSFAAKSVQIEKIRLEDMRKRSQMHKEMKQKRGRSNSKEKENQKIYGNKRHHRQPINDTKTKSFSLDRLLKTDLTESDRAKTKNKQDLVKRVIKEMDEGIHKRPELAISPEHRVCEQKSSKLPREKSISSDTENEHPPPISLPPNLSQDRKIPAPAQIKNETIEPTKRQRSRRRFSDKPPSESMSNSPVGTAMVKELGALRIPKIEKIIEKKIENKQQNIKPKTVILPIAAKIPKFKISPFRIPKKKPYPRKAIIGGKEWVRHYSKNDRKYYWLLTLDGKTCGKEWNPWRKNGEKAPWLKSVQHWQKFVDRDEQKAYYYNYKTRESTFDRPKEFESEPEIEYDSADDDF